MSEQLYQRIEVPPEPWSHENNPEWLFIEDWNDGPYMLVPVEPDYEAALQAYMKPETAAISFAEQVRVVVDAALGDSDE